VQKVAVVGLGRFGMMLARQLTANGAEVIAIERTTNLVNEIKDDVDVAVKLDATDETALVSQGIDAVDVCVVAIGDNFEAALLTTVILKKLGVPRIVCRAQTNFHAEIFRRIGADEVIQPEAQAGEHLARRLANPQLQDFISLAEGFALIELRVPAPFHGKTLLQIQLRAKYGVNLVAVKRPAAAEAAVESDAEPAEQYEIVSVPQPNEILRPKDVLVLVGSSEALEKLPKE